MQTESMGWICNSCGGTGKVKCPANKMEESMLIVCSHCSTPSAYGWCKDSGIGDEITGINFSNFQRTWQCAECGLRHKLSKDFYEDQITFTPRRFVDLKQLELERDIKEQKHLPAWTRNALDFWEANRKYLMYSILGVLLLFLITFATFLIFGYLGICNLNEARSICSNTLFISLAFFGLLVCMFFLNPFIDIFFGIVTNMLLGIYKLRRFRE